MKPLNLNLINVLVFSLILGVISPQVHAVDPPDPLSLPTTGWNEGPNVIVFEFEVPSGPSQGASQGPSSSSCLNDTTSIGGHSSVGASGSGGGGGASYHPTTVGGAPGTGYFLPNAVHQRIEQARVNQELHSVNLQAQASFTATWTQATTTAIPQTSINQGNLQALAPVPASQNPTISRPSQSVGLSSNTWKPRLTEYNPQIEVDRQFAGKYLNPPIEAARGNDLAALAESVERSLKATSDLYRSNNPAANNMGLYIKHELEAEGIIDAQGVIRHQGVEFDSTALKSSLYQNEGRELRNSLNWVLTADKVAQAGCGQGNAPELGRLCEGYQEWSQEARFSHLLADRLLVHHQNEEFGSLSQQLKAQAAFAKGFVTGVGHGVQGLVTAIPHLLAAVPQLIIHLPELTQATYHALVNYEDTWTALKNSAANQYERMRHTNAEEWGAFAGQCTVDLALVLIPGGVIAGRVETAARVARGVELAAGRAVLEVGVEASIGAGRVAGETAEALLEATAAGHRVHERVQAGAEILEAAGNVAGNRAAFARYSRDLREAMQRPHVEDPRLRNFMSNQFRLNAEIGSGSTAAAIRYERATGEMIRGRTHIVKGQNDVRGLRDWLRENPTARPGDRAAAENVLRDLVDALGDLAQ